MLNDQEDKYEGDDSEYHFSDEEINYDMDAAETPKASAAPVAPEAKSSGVGNMLQSKRMLISGGVFVALILVVYKMVSPSAPTDINLDDMKAVPVVAQTQAPATTVQGYNAKATVNKASAPISAPAPAPAMAVKNETQTVQMPTMPTMPATPTYQQQPAQVSAAYNTQSAPAMSMPTMPAAPAKPEIPASASQTFAVPGAEAADSKVVTLAVQNQRLMEQLQAQYDERIKDYQNQNKNLQEQVQSLSTKVSGMENQLTEMSARFSKKGHAAAPAAEQPEYAPAASPHSEAQPKIPYNVQAIIPGRAWLKSDNGETVTVAEGDVVKGVGRVTKIDPYDGIVEINTGKRIAALSYGNGA